MLCIGYPPFSYPTTSSIPIYQIRSIFTVRGGIEIRTHDGDKTPHIPLFLHNIPGPDYYTVFARNRVLIINPTDSQQSSVGTHYTPNNTRTNARLPGTYCRQDPRFTLAFRLRTLIRDWCILSTHDTRTETRLECVARSTPRSDFVFSDQLLWDFF